MTKRLALFGSAAIVLGLLLALWPTVAAAVGAVTLLGVLALRAPMRLTALCAAAVVLGGLLAMWPGVALAVAAVALVSLLAWRAPAYGFVVALVLFGFEGTLKERLTFGTVPVSVSGTTIGAGVLDLCLLIAGAGLFVRYRSGLRETWAASGRIVRTGALLLAAWLVLGIVQIAQNGDLTRGFDGFRLIHWYALAAVGGVLLARRDRRVLDLMLVLIAVVAAYGALRTLIGPSATERAYALSRLGVTQYGLSFRDVGSFSGAVGLASFLAPAGIFAFVLALLSARLRVLGLTLAAFALVAVIGSYARVAIVAMVVAVLAAAALTLKTARLSRRQNQLAAGVIAAALALAAGGTVLASRSSPQLRARAHVFIHPLSDASVRLRLDNWWSSVQLVAEHPLGTGTGSVGRATSLSGAPTVTTDNTYLQILREQGIPGGALFLFGILVTLAGLVVGIARAPASRRPVAIAAVSAFFCFALLGAAGEYFEQPGKVLAWTFLGLAAGAVSMRELQPQ